MRVKAHFLPKQADCPCCGATLNGAGVAYGPPDSGAPTTGDYTVCSFCFEVLRFADGHRYTWVPVAEVATFDVDLVRGLVIARAFAIGMRVLETRDKAKAN